MAISPRFQRASIGSEILESVAYVMHRTKFALAGLRGRGTPEPRSRWDEQYRSGVWSYLDSASEIAHYMVIVGYVQHFSTNPAVLDVGCGHGRLFQLLQRYPLRNYLGIDHSGEAIRRARSMVKRNVRFERVAFEDFVPAERYDVIIFNESIYYSPRPAELLSRYARALTSDGVMIVSMCQNRWQRSIWTSLMSAADLLHSTTVSNEKNLTWHVRVFRPDPRSIP